MVFFSYIIWYVLISHSRCVKIAEFRISNSHIRSRPCVKLSHLSTPAKGSSPRFEWLATVAPQLRASRDIRVYDTLKGTITQHSGHIGQIFKTEKTKEIQAVRLTEVCGKV